MSEKDINKNYNKYIEEINNLTEDLDKKMRYLRKLVGELKNKDCKKIVGQLLIHLRYLIKHIAFKEEQECRILEIYLLGHGKISSSDDYKQMYVEYEPEALDCITEVYLGPKTTGKELFEDFMKHFVKRDKMKNISVKESTNPLA